jgi:hypothetical protein
MTKAGQVETGGPRGRTKMAEVDWDAKKDAWISQVSDLVETIKSWGDERHWLIDEHTKKLTEEHLGSYSVPELFIKTPQGQIVVEPVGRNIIGAEGRVDISSFPSFNRLLLVSLDGQWVVKTDSRITWPAPWGKQTFYDIVDSLVAD